MTEGPSMAPRTVDPEPWTPCRRHLFEAYAAVAPSRRYLTRWIISDVLWENMRRDPLLNGDLMVDYTRHHTLLGIPVDLIPGPAITIRLSVAVDCRPGRG